MSPLKYSLLQVLGSFVQSFSLCKGALPAAKVFSNSHVHPKEAIIISYVYVLGGLAGTRAMTSSDSGVFIELEPQVLKDAFT